MELSDISLQYIKHVDLSHRQKMGQYFTPKSIRDKLMEKLPKISNALILEPSCGSGEFLTSIYDNFENPKVHAIELDKRLYDISTKNFPNTIFHNEDALKFNSNFKYDFIIGNPPYFEFTPNKEIENIYADIIKGRVNIYGLFIKKGLDLLKDGGYLAYVIPTSINNGAYFSKLREYIINTAEIEEMIMFNENSFEDAQQMVMVLILKKEKNTGKFIFKKGDITIFSKEANMLNKSFENKKSLKELGFKVKTGGIVWNQHKDKLTNNSKSTTLIWAHNIVDNKLLFNNNSKKKQFIKIKNNEDKTAIVVNRIIGIGDGVSLRAAIVKRKLKWQAENHVNIIYKKNAKIKELAEIHKQITSPEALKVIKAISGNTQLSKTELENLIPIKL